MSRPAAATVARELAQRLRALPSPTTPACRAVRREYSRALRDAEARFVVAVASELQGRRAPAVRFVASELILEHPAALASLRSADLRRLGKGMASWSDVDIFGCYLSGPAWRERQVPDSLIHGWARSRDLWWRRAALVSTVPLNVKARGGSGDTPRTLAVCELLGADREDMVVKALSWALRSLAQQDPAAVRRFMEERGHELAARVRREVGNKLRTGLKNPRAGRAR